MSGSNGNPAGPTGAAEATTQAIVQPWMDYWKNVMEQNTQWTQALMAGAPPNVDASTLRGHWLEAMSKSLDAYLRSPSFLEGMRRNAEAMTATKISSNLAKVELARQAGVPHIEDIRGLYDRLETAHELVLDRLQSIEKRLDAIDKKLDSRT